MEAPLPESGQHHVIAETKVSDCGVQTGQSLSREELLDAQQAWGAGIIEISSLFLNDGDYVSRAQTLVEQLYGYADGPVLFKPTLACERPFRSTQAEALSYFVGGVVDEDLGFAIRPWRHMYFGEQHIVLQGTHAMAMGEYYFIDYNQPEPTKVEFTFGYRRTKDGLVKIDLHHSSVPYTRPN